MVKAFIWTRYEHEYNSVYSKHDWSYTTKIYGQKNCKGKFLKDTDEIEMDIDPCNTDQDKDAIEKGHDTLPCKSSKHDQI